jgi:hypothetical protein
VRFLTLLQKKINSNIASCLHEDVVITKSMAEYTRLREQGKIDCDSSVKALVKKYTDLAMVQNIREI